jgi:hypothetical protein
MHTFDDINHMPEVQNENVIRVGAKPAASIRQDTVATQLHRVLQVLDGTPRLPSHEAVLRIRLHHLLTSAHGAQPTEQP